MFGTAPGSGFVRRRFRRYPVRFGDGSRLAFAAGFFEESVERAAVVILPERRLVFRVSGFRFVEPARATEHAHEVRGDSGVSARLPQRFEVVRLGCLVVTVERRGDGESILDPWRGRCGLPRLARVSEKLQGRARPASGKRRTASAEQCLRSYRRLILGKFRSLKEVFPGGDMVALLKRDVGEPEQRFRGFVEAFGEREVQPARDIDLSGGQRSACDREAVLEQISGIGGIVPARPAGAGGEQCESDDGRGRTQSMPVSKS